MAERKFTANSGNQRDTKNTLTDVNKLLKEDYSCPIPK
jgi:hypothetical protein